MLRIHDPAQANAIDPRQTAEDEWALRFAYLLQGDHHEMELAIRRQLSIAENPSVDQASRDMATRRAEALRLAWLLFWFSDPSDSPSG